MPVVKSLIIILVAVRISLYMRCFFTCIGKYRVSKKILTAVFALLWIFEGLLISISYIALPIGLKAKSSKVTIVAAVLIACFSHGNIRGYTLLGNWYGYILLIVLSVLSIYLSVRNIEIDDVI